MPRAKKQEEETQPDEITQQAVFLQQPDELPNSALRLQLLSLSKEILEHQSHLAWETQTKFVDVSIEDIVDGAKYLLDFVQSD